MLLRWCLCAFCVTVCSSLGVDMSMRADVTFNDYNDRFDVGDIINEQNRQFRDFVQPMDYEDTRRALPLHDVLKQDRRRHLRSQKHRRYEGSEEDFVQSYQPRMVDDNDELEQYNTNLENFRRQKPPEIIARRNIYGNKVVIPAIDNVKTKDDLVTSKFLQGVIVEELKPKNTRRKNDNAHQTETKYNVLPKNAKVKVMRYIDTKGRRNNQNRATPENRVSDWNAKDSKGVILKNLNGGKKLANGRRVAEAKTDDETLLNYAVPLRMTVKGYLELPKP